MRVYLDYNATAPLRPEAAERMREIMAQPANPSSVHSFGREAKKYLESARQIIADAVSAWPNEVIFTASGTEANNTALRGFSDRRILVSAVEHSSVLSLSLRERVAAEGGRVREVRHTGQYNTLHIPYPNPLPKGEGVISVTPAGLIDLPALDALLADGEPALVSVMLANNETGVIQPIAEISVICKKYSALLHCDAVQALGKIPVDFGALGCDMMTLSAHKCGGPAGAAALIVRRDLPIVPLLIGGGQELRRRAGTESVAAIGGFARAVELFDFGQMKKLCGWLDEMENEMQLQGAVIFGKDASRLPNTSYVAMPSVSNEVQLMDFDLAGFAVSAGSACSSGRIEPSYVLAAMGVPEELATGAIRISGGWNTTGQEVLSFTEHWRKTCRRLTDRPLMAGRK